MDLAKHAYKSYEVALQNLRFLLWNSGSHGSVTPFTLNYCWF